MHVSRKKRIMLLFISFIHSSTFPRSFRKRMRSEKKKEKNISSSARNFLFSLSNSSSLPTLTRLLSRCCINTAPGRSFCSVRRLANASIWHPAKEWRGKKPEKTLIDFDCVLHKFKRQKKMWVEIFYFSLRRPILMHCIVVVLHILLRLSIDSRLLSSLVLNIQDVMLQIP